MKARILEIQDRQRKHLMMPLSIEDFTVRTTGNIDIDTLIDNPLVSLCCLDDSNQQLIFAELPQEADPVKAPFYYLEQFESAIKLYAISYDDSVALSKQVKPAVSNLLFIHNIGRCGSTLLHQVFSRLDDIISLSEPDCIGYMRYLRTIDGQKDNHLKPLLRACTLLLFKAPNFHNVTSNLGVIKLRNQSLQDLDLLTEVFPDAKHLFLYRSLEGWVSSIYSRRLHRQAPLELNLTDLHAFWERYHNRPINLAEYGFTNLNERLSIIEELTISWLIMMDHYLDCIRSDIKMPALRYEELISEREGFLSWLAQYLDLPKDISKTASKAFEQDSQAGTRLARPDAQTGSAISYSQKEKEQMLSLLKQHREIKTSDYFVDGHVFL